MENTKNITSLVVNRFQAAKLLNCSVQAIDNLRKEGKLSAPPDVPGVQFNLKDIEDLAKVESEYSPFRYRLLKEENEQLKACIKQYKKALSKIRIALEVNAIREVDDEQQFI